MAEADWATLTSPALDSVDVPRGVSSAFTVPNSVGANVFTYAFRSASSATGFAGKYVDLTNFNPIAVNKGVSIRGAMKHYSSGTGYAPMMGVMKGTDPTTSEGYMIGLSEGSSYQICTKKGSPAGGMDPAGSDILQISDAAFTAVGDAATTWFHLRMDVLVNPHGEVVINVYQNDLDTYHVDSGVSWAAITGMDQFIDDPTGVFSGSTPELGPFYVFFGMYTESAGSVAIFDHIEVHRQTAP